ncbi:uncharacterized protein BJ212DRAFT_1280136, partial [Suillus subaureus]
FNIYIYDYYNKHRFCKTACELLVETDILPDSAPPINARQGLLFEYVLLDLFLKRLVTQYVALQMVECFLGTFHSKKQWNRNG